MPILTDFLNLKKPLLTEAADVEVLNDNMDILDDKLKDVCGRQKRRLVYITESQQWTAPDDVSSIDIYLVNGGENGADGDSTDLSDGYSPGGDGGAGGACFYLPGYRVSPGSVHNVVVGAAGGGITSFDGLSINVGNAPGGVSDRGNPENGNGSGAVLYGQLEGLACPLDGQYYGISGAAGGYSKANNVGTSAQAGLGGAAAVIANGSLTVPQYGGHGSTASTSYNSNPRYFCGGGGGGSKDNAGTDGTWCDKQTAEVPAVAGNGANAAATSYGCGGGGGAGGYPSYMEPGTGGQGAQGVCIIAY